MWNGARDEQSEPATDLVSAKDLRACFVVLNFVSHLMVYLLTHCNTDQYKRLLMVICVDQIV